jgi:hypothetical protein
MAMISIEVLLRAHHANGERVTSENFLLRFSGLDASLSAVADREPGFSGKVVFFALTASRFRDEDDPQDALQTAIARALGEVANWLNSQSTVAIEAMRQEGLELTVLFDVEIDQDQLELALPPAFLSACSRLNMQVEIVTND